MLRLIAFCCLVPMAPAADKEDTVKQKAVAEETWKKLSLKTKTAHETPDVLLYSTLPEAKLKSLAETVQRTVSAARTNLGIVKDESPFAGKLTLYVFADPADLKMYIRQVEQRKPEPKEHIATSLRGTAPAVAISPPSGAKLTDSDFATLAATWVGAATLSRKVGVASGTLPEWLQTGYGRAALVRGEKSEKASLWRSKMKAVVLATGSKAVACKQLWSGEPVADAELASASFVDFLAFGPGEDKFQKFCKSLNDASAKEDKPTTEEMMTAAFAACEWNEAALDAAWKQWVLKGSK